MRETEIHLGEPPVVAGIGVGVHGVAGRTDVFRLPELWQLHLYQYEAELTCTTSADRSLRSVGRYKPSLATVLM